MGFVWGGITVPLIIAAAALIVVLVCVFIIKRKIQKFSMEAFGTKSFLQGYKERKRMLSETPKSVRSMTPIYLAQITSDFPEFDYDLYREKAMSVLRSYFVSIAGKDTSNLTEECSLTLKNNVQGIIEGLNSRCYTQHFDEVAIHSMEICRYIKNGATVNIIFNSAVGLYNYITDDRNNDKIVFGSEEEKLQTVYNVELVYVQDADKMNVYSGDAVGIHCPNCGAPIKNLGIKFCEYCGTGVTEVNFRSWKFDAVHEETRLKTAY